MILNIVSPEKILYIGEIEFITLPGSCSPFTILEQHAPIISTLSNGYLTYRAVHKQNISIKIKRGFVQKQGNTIIVCIECK